MRLHSTPDKHFSLSQQIRSLLPYWAKGIFLSKIYRNNRLHVIKGYKNHIIISRLRIAIPLEGFLLKKQNAEFHEQYLRIFVVFLHLM
jgi:hypothetical protein